MCCTFVPPYLLQRVALWGGTRHASASGRETLHDHADARHPPRGLRLGGKQRREAHGEQDRERDRLHWITSSA